MAKTTLVTLPLDKSAKLKQKNFQNPLNVSFLAQRIYNPPEPVVLEVRKSPCYKYMTGSLNICYGKQGLWFLLNRKHRGLSKKLG
jgi:hypothetical protein